MENNKNILSIRIKNLRTELGLTQEELALKLGLKGKSSIANYESDKITPSDEVKLKMCKIFDCSMDYLMGNSEFKTNEDFFRKYKENLYHIDINDAIMRAILKNTISQKFNLSKYGPNIRNFLKGVDIEQLSNKEIEKFVLQFPEINKIDFISVISEIKEDILFCKSSREQYSYFKNEANSKQYYMCPVYGQISAGQPNWAEENIEGRLMIDPNLMGIVNPEEHFFLRVNGESMNKVVKNGSYALIHKQDIVEDGEIAVVLVNGYDATLKKFSKQGDFIILEPVSDVVDDPNIKTQIYDKTTSIKILGKYVGKFELNK